MKSLSIGNLRLGEVPRIAVPLADDDVPGDLEAIAGLADIVELRIDCFADLSPAHAADVAREVRTATHGALPVIATVRSADEGGRAALDDAERDAVYDAVIPHVDAVDVELRASLRDRILERAHGRLTIASFHDFARTPPLGELQEIVERGRACGADIVKLATTAGSIADVVTLLELTLRNRGGASGLVVMAMGEVGAISRVFFPLAGSCITYGYHRMPSAPGQLPLAQLHDALRTYYPGFRRRHISPMTEPEP